MPRGPLRDRVLLPLTAPCSKGNDLPSAGSFLPILGGDLLLDALNRHLRESSADAFQGTTMLPHIAFLVKAPVLWHNKPMQTFQSILKEIDQLFAGYQARRPLSPDEQAARYAKLRLEWTYHSNAIEGNSLTLSETQFYLREGLTSEGKPFTDYVAAKNHAEAIDWLFDYAKGRKPITEGFIKDLNALLHKGITTQSALGWGGERIAREISPGAYKTRPNHVLTLSGEIHHYVDPLQVHGEMEKLVEMIGAEEGKKHPVELSAAVHYEFTRIHPFDDCNGRGARLLLNLILMRAGFPPIVIKIEERRRYIEALEAGDQGKREPFYVFVAEHVRQSLQ